MIDGAKANVIPQADNEPFEVRLSDESFETYELDPPPYTMQTTKKELKQMYYDMVAIRYATFTAIALSGCVGANHLQSINSSSMKC